MSHLSPSRARGGALASRDWLVPGERLALDEAGHLLIVPAGGPAVRADARPTIEPRWLHAPVTAQDEPARVLSHWLRRWREGLGRRGRPAWGGAALAR